MAVPAIYVDECIDDRLVAALRRIGIDMVTIAMSSKMCSVLS